MGKKDWGGERGGYEFCVNNIKSCVFVFLYLDTSRLVGVCVCVYYVGTHI